MDEEKMDVRSDTQGFAAPILPENGGNLDADFAPKLPFAASGREMALAFFMYLLAYLYLQSAAWCFPVFCALSGHAARGRELVLARLRGGDGACRDVWRKPRLGRLYAAVYPCVCGLLCPLPLGTASGRGERTASAA